MLGVRRLEQIPGALDVNAEFALERLLIPLNVEADPVDPKRA